MNPGRAPRPKPQRPDKAARRADQRRVARERQAQQDLRRRADQTDLVPVRDDDGRYRP